METNNCTNGHGTGSARSEERTEHDVRTGVYQQDTHVTYRYMMLQVHFLGYIEERATAKSYRCDAPSSFWIGVYVAMDITTCRHNGGRSSMSMQR
jgi:hypothetical protein